WKKRFCRQIRPYDNRPTWRHYNIISGRQIHFGAWTRGHTALPNVSGNPHNRNPFWTHDADVSADGVAVSPQLTTHRVVDDRRPLFTGNFFGKKLTPSQQWNAKCTE